MSVQAEVRVWRALSAAHARMATAMEEDLRSASGLSLKEHQVLSELAGGPEGRIRLNELADLLALTPSGISRLVDRLQLDKLVVRTTCPSDRRGFLVELTDLGRSRLEAAQARHAEALQRLLGELPDEVLIKLAESLERVSDKECAGGT